jgi:hypothetical protein
LWSGCVARIWRGFKYFELAGISVPQLHSSSASCPEENMNQRRGIRKANNSGDRGVPRLAGTVLLWITAVLAMATLPTTAHTQELTSFSDNIGKHVVFVANDYHVHQRRCSAACYISSNWVNEDLTQMAGGPPFQPPSSFQTANLTSFSDAAGEHVFYRDPNTLHLNQLRFAGGVWSYQDLGVSASGWGPSTSGYSNGGVERLFYTTSDRHVHMQRSQDGGLSWSDGDLTKGTGGTLAWYSLTAITSFHDSSGEHVFYVGDNGDLYQLYGYWYTREVCVPTPYFHCYLGSFLGWVNQDLGIRPDYQYQLTSFSDAMGEHVFYIAYDGVYVWNIHEHFNPSGGSGWVDNNWGVAKDPFFVQGLMISFSNNILGEQLFYVGQDTTAGPTYGSHVYQLYGTNGMRQHLVDLTMPPFIPFVSENCASTSGLSDSSAGFSGSDDVFYAAQDGDLHQLLIQPQPGGNGTVAWSDVNLTHRSFPPTFGGSLCH